MRPSFMRRARLCEDLAGIQNSLRIERALQVPHHREFNRVRTPRKFRRLEPADSMFGADAAAETVHQIEDGMLERGATLQECRFVGAGTLAHVEMQIAVAQVAVADDLALRNQEAH